MESVFRWNPFSRMSDREFCGGEYTIMLSALEALECLREGNRRFVSGAPVRGAFFRQPARSELVAGQMPFSIILGCSDSRVPVEIIFDQGPGDLFVVRVAGNIVTPSQTGSVEYAAERFGTRLVVVLGHSHCGAVLSAVNEIEHPTDNLSPNLRSIIDRIRPSVERLPDSELRHNPDELVRQAVRANIRASINHLRQDSPILEQRIHNDGLRIVAAEYSQETGVVDFFEGLPETG
jgi:carbonic anhydrase